MINRTLAMALAMALLLCPCQSGSTSAVIDITETTTSEGTVTVGNEVTAAIDAIITTGQSADRHHNTL